MNQFEDYKSQRLAVLFDESGHRRRAVLVSPAQDIAPQIVNRVLALTGGLLFVALTPERASAFMLSSMARPRTNTERASRFVPDLNICVSVEAREGVSTGISVPDRTATIRALGDAQPNPRKLVRPGHIFPVETKAGGVLVKHGLAEGALDLTKAAGFTEAALFCDLLNERGDLMSEEEWRELAETEGLPIFGLGQLVRYRLEHETLVQRVAEARLPTTLAGELRSCLYKSSVHSGEHLVLVKGEIDPQQPVLTRVQTEFTFADVFGGKSPPSRQTLHQSLAAIGARGSGVLIYLRRASGGQLREQVESWEDKAREKPAVMMREYGLGAQILRDLGVKKIELLTNSKKNLVGLTTFGIEIVSQIAIPAPQ